MDLEMGVDGRDIRVAASGVCLALQGPKGPSDLPPVLADAAGFSHPAALGRTAAFVDAVMGRYRGRVIGRTGVSFVYQRLRPAVNVTAMEQHTSLRLAPRLAWTLVTRLQSRGERVEAGPGGARTAVAVPPLPGTAVVAQQAPLAQHELPYLPPVPRIVRKEREELSSAVRRPSSVVPAAQGWEAETALQREWPQATPPPLDVNRLTDQVIQAIDRRIVAQRERMGRV